MTVDVFPSSRASSVTIEGGKETKKNPAEERERECDDERQRGREIDICYNGN